MHLHAPQRLADKFRIAEVFGAMGCQRHRRTHRCDESKVHQMRLGVAPMPVDDDIVGLDILVPELGVVVGIERDEQVLAIAHHRSHGIIAKPFDAAERVHPLRHHRERFTRHIAHDIEEPLGGHLVLEHEPKRTGSIERPALTHDLRQARAVLERKHLDNHLIHLAELALGKHGLLDLIGLGDVELAA